MCYRILEQYSECGCLYYQHPVDRCAAYGRPNHGVELRTVYVGYACSEHTRGFDTAEAQPIIELNREPARAPTRESTKALTKAPTREPAREPTREPAGEKYAFIFQYARRCLETA